MRILISSLLLIAALAACGGGGSSGGGPIPQPVTTQTPSPTPNPAATRSVAYTWTGALHPSASASSAALRLMVSASSDPPMAELCNAAVNNNCTVAGDNTVDPKIDVTETGASPLPSSAPTIAPPSGVGLTYLTGSPPFTYQVNPLTSISPGQYSLAVTFADGTTGTVPLNIYEHPVIGCPGGTINSSPASVPAGWSFDNDSGETTIAASDIYVTGLNCPGEFADPSAGSNGYQFHAPYGATIYYVSQIDFATVSPALISNPQTVWQFWSFQSPTTYGFIIGHTKAGGTFAMLITEQWNNGPNPPYTNGDYFGGAVKYAPMGQTFAY